MSQDFRSAKKCSSCPSIGRKVTQVQRTVVNANQRSSTCSTSSIHPYGSNFLDGKPMALNKAILTTRSTGSQIAALLLTSSLVQVRIGTSPGQTALTSQLVYLKGSYVRLTWPPKSHQSSRALKLITLRQMRRQRVRVIHTQADRAVTGQTPRISSSSNLTKRSLIAMLT